MTELSINEIEDIREKLQSIEDMEDLSLFFKVFSDTTRLRIIELLSHGEHCVSDICSVLEISQSAVSHQLATLRKMRLVRTKKEGKVVIYALSDHHIMSIFCDALAHIKE